MKRFQVALRGLHPLLPGTPSPTAEPPVGWLECLKHMLLALLAQVALDVTMFLGTVCLVTADCFKLFGLKRSHFNRKN